MNNDRMKRRKKKRERASTKWAENVASSFDIITLFCCLIYIFLGFFDTSHSFAFAQVVLCIASLWLLLLLFRICGRHHITVHDIHTASLEIIAIAIQLIINLLLSQCHSSPKYETVFVHETKNERSRKKNRLANDLSVWKLKLWMEFVHRSKQIENWTYIRQTKTCMNDEHLERVQFTHAHTRVHGIESKSVSME